MIRSKGRRGFPGQGESGDRLPYSTPSNRYPLVRPARPKRSRWYGDGTMVMNRALCRRFIRSELAHQMVAELVAAETISYLRPERTRK